MSVQSVHCTDTVSCIEYRLVRKPTRPAGWPRAYATQYDTAQLVLAVLLTAPGCKDG